MLQQKPLKTDRLRTFTVKADGKITEGEPLLLRNTLFGAAFPDEEAALFRLEVPDERGFEGMAQRLKLVNAVQDGVRGFHLLGSGHGLKSGKIYATTAEVRDRVHHLFATAEDALAYGGLLFSESRQVLKLNSAKTTVRGLGDGQGWIDSRVLEEHGLPVRQVQIRALWPNPDKTLAKGTLLPVVGLREKEGVDVLFHETQVKSPGKDVGGEFLLAVRDVAQPRTFKSSWTWTQFLDEEHQERLFERHSRPMLAAVMRAMESNDSALAFLDAVAFETDEEREMRDLLTSYLSAGLSPKHPWVHRRMQELVRRTYLDAALALGPVPLAGGMACVLEDDPCWCRHEVTCSWLPEGTYAAMRYPVRDGWSLRLVRNRHRQGVPEGSIAVSPGLMAELDGDQDGDWVALSDDPDVIRGVASMHRREPSRLPIPPRTRKRTALRMLSRVAVDALGASGIGTPTWYVAACIGRDRRDLVPKLSLALQVATMGLKWHIDRDYDLITACQKDLVLPEWLELGRDRAVFSIKAPKVPDIGLGRFWNTCSKAFEEDVLGTPGTLLDYADAVPLPKGDPDVLAEVEVMRSAFNQRVSKSAGDEDEIRAAIRVVRDWGATKKGKQRVEYARACWYMVHRGRSAKSTGSFAIHAFPDVLCHDLQATSGYRRPMEVAPQHDSCSSTVELVEGRAVVRSRKPVETGIELSRDRTTLVRLVGGHRAVQDLYGVPESEAQLFIESLIRKVGPDPVEVSFAWVNAPWNGHRVIRADLKDDCLGYLPEDMAETMDGRLVGTCKATLMTRGKVVFAVVSLVS